jgi:hypothetical protein
MGELTYPSGLPLDNLSPGTAYLYSLYLTSNSTSRVSSYSAFAIGFPPLVSDEWFLQPVALMNNPSMAGCAIKMFGCGQENIDRQRGS